VQEVARVGGPAHYYFVLRYWIKVFGTSEFGVRLLSALFGVLAIPLISLPANSSSTRRQG
jgi:uncharacterized membrane protein